MLCPQLLMTEHGREQAATTGRGMAAGGAWTGCALIWAGLLNRFWLWWSAIVSYEKGCAWG